VNAGPSFDFRRWVDVQGIPVGLHHRVRLLAQHWVNPRLTSFPRDDQTIATDAGPEHGPAGWLVQSDDRAYQLRKRGEKKAETVAGACFEVHGHDDQTE